MKSVSVRIFFRTSSGDLDGTDIIRVGVLIQSSGFSIADHPLIEGDAQESIGIIDGFDVFIKKVDCGGIESGGWKISKRVFGGFANFDPIGVAFSD